MIRKVLVLFAFGCLWPAPGEGQQVQVPLTVQSPETGTAQQTQAPSPAGLEDLVREALQKNPAVQSALHTVEAQRRRVPQAKALPDPAVGIGWAGNIAPFSVQSGDPSSYRAVNASQQLPYPGKLKLRGEIASKEADAALSDYEAVRRRDAKAARQAMKVHMRRAGKNMLARFDWFQRHRDAAEARAEGFPESMQESVRDIQTRDELRLSRESGLDNGADEN